jgi:hypothetical protein
LHLLPADTESLVHKCIKGFYMSGVRPSFAALTRRIAQCRRVEVQTPNYRTIRPRLYLVGNFLGTCVPAPKTRICSASPVFARCARGKPLLSHVQQITELDKPCEGIGNHQVPMGQRRVDTGIVGEDGSKRWYVGQGYLLCCEFESTPGGEYTGCFEGATRV